jgi:hypothetical protein
MMRLQCTKGTKHPASKLTDELVYELRRRYDAGESRQQLAKAFGISPSHVVKIGKRRGWKHLPEVSR